jgi:two-component system NarL family sensor kinase
MDTVYDRLRTVDALTDSTTLERPPETAVSTALEQIARRVEQLSAHNEGLLQRILDGEARFRVLARAVWQAQEEERRRLARELHDSLGQTLTALITKLHAAHVQPGKPDLESSIEIAQIALNDVRELSRLLRPPVLDDLGLQGGLNWLARRMRDNDNLAVDIDWQADEFERLDPEIEMLVFRIAQEALNNVVQHSGRREANVVFRRVGNNVDLVITDDGYGFDPVGALAPDGKSKGLGLRGIRDRVELFGGRLDIQSEPEKGCRIRVTLPIGELRI